MTCAVLSLISLSQMTVVQLTGSLVIPSHASLLLLFPVLFPNHPITQIDNTPRFNYADINAMFVPYYCGALTEWLFRMIGIINTFICDCSRFKQASLWIPQVFLPNPLTPHYATCLSKLTKGWIHNMHTYNSAFFDDCVAAHRVCVQIFNEIEDGMINAGKYSQPDDHTQCSYGTHIDNKQNDEMATTTVAPPFDIVTSSSSPTYGESHLVLFIATVVDPREYFMNGVVLHPDFTASEPNAGDIQTTFGKRFGILFQSLHGEWFSRPILSKELMHCYSIRKKSLTNPTVLLQMDVALDTLLPDCLPYELTKYAAQEVERTNNIYDTMSYASNDQTVAATCCLHSASPSTLLDWPTSCAADK